MAEGRGGVVKLFLDFVISLHIETLEFLVGVRNAPGEAHAPFVRLIVERRDDFSFGMLGPKALGSYSTSSRIYTTSSGISRSTTVLSLTQRQMRKVSASSQARPRFPDLWSVKFLSRPEGPPGSRSLRL